jgi:hypothetical protein
VKVTLVEFDVVSRELLKTLSGEPREDFARLALAYDGSEKGAVYTLGKAFYLMGSGGRVLPFTPMLDAEIDIVSNIDLKEAEDPFVVSVRRYFDEALINNWPAEYATLYLVARHCYEFGVAQAGKDTTDDVAGISAD